MTRPDLSKPNPKSGTVQLSFNISGTVLMARFESAPSAVHLFAFPTTAEWAKNAASGVNHGISPKLKSVLIHSKPVLHAKWNPARRGSLAMCCGSGSMYLWSDEWMGEGGETEEVAECVGVPTGGLLA